MEIEFWGHRIVILLYFKSQGTERNELSSLGTENFQRQNWWWKPMKIRCLNLMRFFRRITTHVAIKTKYGAKFSLICFQAMYWVKVQHGFHSLHTSYPKMLRCYVLKFLPGESEKKHNVFNEPLNNNHVFYFPNLTSFWLSIPKLRFWNIDILFGSLLVEIWSLESERPIWTSSKKGKNRVSISDLITEVYPHGIVIYLRNKLSLFFFCSKTKTDPENCFLSRATGLFKRRESENQDMSQSFFLQVNEYPVTREQ